MSDPKSFEELSDIFKTLLGNQKLLYQFFDLHPTPIEIFAPDGMCVFLNRAGVEMNNSLSAGMYIGKYNVYKDPLMVEILGQENLDKVFRGENWSYSDFPAPIQDLIERGAVVDKPYEAATMDLICLPIWDDDVFVCTVCFFFIKNMYQGRTDVAKAQEYMEIHWRDDFDLDKVAQTVNLSRFHFIRVFKEVTKCTPSEFYQKIKIEKIKETLLDGNLSIEQAFETCGVDYRGKTYLTLFKEVTQKTPTEYRKEMMNRNNTKHLEGLHNE